MIRLPFGFVLMSRRERERLEAQHRHILYVDPAPPAANIAEALAEAKDGDAIFVRYRGVAMFARVPACDRRVLAMMAESGSCTTRASIASEAGVTEHSVARVVDRLHTRGFIRPCRLDSGWFITDAGRAAVAQSGSEGGTR